MQCTTSLVHQIIKDKKQNKKISIMKTKALVLALTLLSSISIFASNGDKKIYSNNSELSKEYTIMNEETLAPSQKIMYKYNQLGNRTERVVYSWSVAKGWVGTQKTEYIYDADDQLVTIAYTNWDKGTNNWSEATDYIAYSSNKENNLSNGTLASLK